MTGFILFYANDPENAEALVTSLREKELKVAHIDPTVAERLGSDAAVGTCAGLLMANDVPVVISSGGDADMIREACGFLMVVGEGGDITDTSPEAVLGALEEQGFVGSTEGAYTAEEEEEIRKRLESLGYL